MDLDSSADRPLPILIVARGDPAMRFLQRVELDLSKFHSGRWAQQLDTAMTRSRGSRSSCSPRASPALPWRGGRSFRRAAISSISAVPCSCRHSASVSARQPSRPRRG